TSDNESKSIEPVKDDSSVFTTFPNLLFIDKDNVTIHEDDVPIEESKVHSNPLFDNDEINSDELESHDNDSQREEIDIVTSTDELLPPSVENDDDSDGETDAVDDLRVDNSISKSEHQHSDDEASDFDNPSYLRLEPVVSRWDGTFMYSLVYLNIVERPMEIPDFQTFPKDK
nr:hypothetical protein [Tanacetum cinerariifolium]